MGRKYNKMELNAKEYEKNACILYQNLQDINQTVYDYWLINKKQRTEIDRLREIISEHRNKSIEHRNIISQQKRREENLLDKINSLQTHSRQVSSISALFDGDYKLDIEELQELHISAEKEKEKENNNDNDNDNDDSVPFDDDALDESQLTETRNNKNKKRKNSVIINEKLDRITLETEITELKVKLEAKDIKIRELEIEVNSWQETHSQIYDSFTSATKIYRERIEQFNNDEKYYKDKNNDLEKHLEILQQQLTIKSRNSIENNEQNEDENKTYNKYTDIEAELEYNSDSSSSSISDIDDSDEPVGGGHHVRRGSKPW